MEKIIWPGLEGEKKNREGQSVFIKEIFTRSSYEDLRFLNCTALYSYL